MNEKNYEEYENLRKVLQRRRSILVFIGVVFFFLIISIEKYLVSLEMVILLIGFGILWLIDYKKTKKEPYYEEYKKIYKKIWDADVWFGKLEHSEKIELYEKETKK